jgi:hypothetical protein
MIRVSSSKFIHSIYKKTLKTIHITSKAKKFRAFNQKNPKRIKENNITPITSEERIT